MAFSEYLNYNNKGGRVTYGCPNGPTFFLNGALMYISKFEKQSMKTKHLGNSVYVLLFYSFLLSKRKKIPQACRIFASVHIFTQKSRFMLKGNIRIYASFALMKDNNDKDNHNEFNVVKK